MSRILTKADRIMQPTEYGRTHETENRRVRWVYDDDYETGGFYAYGAEAETRSAEEAELEGLRSGSLVALGAIVETRCAACGSWTQVDSLWEIVVSLDDDLEKLGTEMLDIPAEELKA